MELDDTLCYCFHITRRKVVNFVRVHRPRRASQIAECGGAGTGCGWCIPYLKRCFEQGQVNSSASENTISANDYAQQRAAYIRSGKGKAAPGAIPLPPADSMNSGLPHEPPAEGSGK